MVIDNITTKASLDQYLQDYAVPAYFTDITVTNDYITCNDSTGAVLYFRVRSYDSIYKCTPYEPMQLYGQNVSAMVNRIYNYKTAITKAIRTQYGIILCVKDYSVSDATPLPWIIITKDNEDNTVIFMHPEYSADTASIEVKYVVRDNYALSSRETGSNVLRTCWPPNDDFFELTSLVPMVVENTMKYTPNLKWVVQKQYDEVGEIVVGTEHYWTDGQIALRDT